MNLQECRRGRKFYHHYIIFDRDCVKNDYFPIRVLGRTVGTIQFQKEDKIITDVIIDTDNGIISYPSHIFDITFTAIFISIISYNAVKTKSIFQ